MPAGARELIVTVSMLLKFDKILRFGLNGVLGTRAINRVIFDYFASIFQKILTFPAMALIYPASLLALLSMSANWRSPPK